MGKTKHIPLFVLLTLLSFFSVVSCRPKQTPNGRIRNIELPMKFYKKFKGTIANKNVVLDLQIIDSIADGNYYEERVNKMILLDGRLEKDGTIRLAASDELNNLIGDLNVYFSTITKIEGDAFIKGQENGKVDLHETTEGVIPIVYQDFKKDYCDRANRNKSHLSDDMSPEDTVCSSLNIQFIQAGMNSHIGQMISKALEKKTCDFLDPNSPNVIAAMNSLVRSDEEHVFDLSTKGFVTYNESPVLSIRFENTSMTYGAAHENFNVSYINIDTRSGEQITLESILDMSKRAELNRLAGQFLSAQASDESLQINSDSVELPDNFAPIHSGLIFTFQPYQVGAYATGSISFFIPYSALKPYILPNSVLTAMGVHIDR